MLNTQLKVLQTCIFYGNENRDYERNKLWYDFHCCAEITYFRILTYSILFISFLYLSCFIDVSCSINIVIFCTTVNTLSSARTPCILKNSFINIYYYKFEWQYIFFHHYRYNCTNISNKSCKLTLLKVNYFNKSCLIA